MNKLQFRTKVNTSGNTKLLDIDYENKTFRYGYCFRYAYESDIFLTLREMKKLVELLEVQGFKRIDE